MNDISALPKDFVSRVEAIVPQKQKQEVYKALTSKRPTTFRTNTLKITMPILIEKLHDLGIKYTKVPWYEDAFILESSHEDFMKTGLFESGLIYVQSLSSMLPPLILEPQRGEIIADMAAAPGSKTSQLAALMQNTGTIYANDISRIRLFKLAANLKLLGVKNTKTTKMEGQLYWKKYSNHFDKILLDAPCSLEGRFNTQAPKTFKDWSVKKVKKLAKLQRNLLRSAISCTKMGGIIVYSTCTLSPEENEGVINEILTKYKDAIEVQSINTHLDNTSPAVTQWEGQSYSQEISKSLRLNPSILMEGFFVVRLKKIGEAF